MQTSSPGSTGNGQGDRTRPRGRRGRAVLKVVAVLVTFVAVDVVLSLILEPYSSHSDVVWQDYRSRVDEPIDTLFLGSSSTEMGFNPDVIDAEAGTYSFNLATPAAGINNCRDTLRDVLGDHDIKKVVVGINYATMTSKHEINATLAITQAKMQGVGLPQSLHYVGEIFSDQQTMLGTKSLAALVPWSVLHVDYDYGAIKANVVRRLTLDPVTAAEQFQAPWTYVSRGFSGIPGPSLGFDNTTDSVETSENGLDFSDENVSDLLEIIKMCKDRGIDVIVCVPPRPAFRTLMYGDAYPQNMGDLERQVEQAGATYLDFNLAKPSLYNPPESTFRDEYHLTLDGANEFSALAGRVFADVWSGADVNDEFFTYDSWDAYLQSLDVDDFSPAFFGYEVNDGSIDIHPWTLAGPNVTIEYQVLAKEAGQSDFQVIQDWATAADCTYQTTGHGECTIRVITRPQGHDEATQHICDKVIAY